MTDVVAIDANLFLRHTVRRFLCAMQEVRGGQVPVPAEVLRESVRKYPRIVGSTRTGFVAPCTSGRTGRATSRHHGRHSSREDAALVTFGEDRFSYETCASVCSKPMQAGFFARG